MYEHKRWRFLGKDRMLQFIRNKRRSHVLTFFANAAEKYLRAWYNEDFWASHLNGEDMVLDTLSRSTSGNLLVFDIGANVGNWTTSVLERIPHAQVHCFEIVPETFLTLRERFDDRCNITLHQLGLSDRSGFIEVTVDRTNSTVSSINPRFNGSFFNEHDSKRVKCRIIRGDELRANEKIGRIDYLKIDVEGHELSVLRGFETTLKIPEYRPRIIQFEYGNTYIPSGATLFQVASILEPNGYRIGRIFSKYVDFKKYDLGDEHFRMGNYLAIQENDPILQIFAG